MCLLLAGPAAAAETAKENRMSALSDVNENEAKELVVAPAEAGESEASGECLSPTDLNTHRSALLWRIGGHPDLLGRKMPNI